MTKNERIEWETFENYHTPRSNDWYWMVITIAVLAAIASGFMGNLIFSVLIVITTFIIILFAQKPERQISCALTKYGILINKDLYPFEHIRSFWVSEEPNVDLLIVELNATVFSHLFIPLTQEVFPDTVRSYLTEFVPEVKYVKRFSDVLNEYFGF